MGNCLEDSGEIPTFADDNQTKDYEENTIDGSDGTGGVIVLRAADSPCKETKEYRLRKPTAGGDGGWQGYDIRHLYL